jgi:hypothetical protein
MEMTMTTKHIKLACAIAAVCAATGAVTAIAAEAPTAESHVAAADNVPASTVQYPQWHRFAELRRERSTPDALPTEWQQALADDTAAGFRWGANPKLSRRAAPGVWLVPGNGFVCVAIANLRDGSFGFSCANELELERGLLQPADLDANGTGVVTGVLPDGVESVTLVDRDGSRRDAAVERNVYRAAVDSDLKEVRWTDGAGVERVLPMGWVQ